MFETSFPWLVLFATAAIAALIPRDRPTLRAALLAVSSALVLAFAVGLGAASLGVLAAACAWVLVGIRLTAPLARTRPMTASLLAFAPVLGLLILARSLGGEWSFLQFVGLSFFAVKAWTFIKDVHDQKVKRFDVPTVLAYLLFFPTYALGPMHLYPEMARSVAEPSPLDGEDVLDAAFRITLGLAKIKILAPLLAPVSLLALRDAAAYSPSQLLIGAFVFSIVMWADFSGFSDLAIGASRLLGVTAPENFRAPYAAPNLREFWQRWHITFSRVLTGYVFVPLSRRLAKTWLGGRARALAAVTTMVTFLICGWWHGETLGFVLWGAYHGLGLVALDLLKPARPVARSTPRRLLGVAVTFAYVSLGWIPFVLPLEHLLP